MGNPSFVFFAAAAMKSRFQLDRDGPRQGATASSNTESERSGITRSSEMPRVRPNPSHCGHAPTGLLKLNICSLGSGNRMPSASKRFEKLCRLTEPSEFQTKITSSSCPSKKAVSDDSARRETSSLSVAVARRSTSRRGIDFSLSAGV